mmetsp:Transcript_56497/g.104617  ORF Transcript_56497/g.104617 Transcript_56497/m.104617 type:complete len:237 (-) Transcript_56497:68-778(-)
MQTATTPDDLHGPIKARPRQRKAKQPGTIPEMPQPVAIGAVDADSLGIDAIDWPLAVEAPVDRLQHSSQARSAAAAQRKATRKNRAEKPQRAGAAAAEVMAPWDDMPAATGMAKLSNPVNRLPPGGTESPGPAQPAAEGGYRQRRASAMAEQRYRESISYAQRRQTQLAQARPGEAPKLMTYQEYRKSICYSSRRPSDTSLPGFQPPASAGVRSGTPAAGGAAYADYAPPIRQPVF